MTKIRLRFLTLYCGTLCYIQLRSVTPCYIVPRLATLSCVCTISSITLMYASDWLEFSANQTHLAKLGLKCNTNVTYYNTTWHNVACRGIPCHNVAQHSTTCYPNVTQVSSGCRLHIFPQNVAYTWVLETWHNAMDKRDTMTGPLQEKSNLPCMHVKNIHH